MNMHSVQGHHAQQMIFKFQSQEIYLHIQKKTQKQMQEFLRRYTTVSTLKKDKGAAKDLKQLSEPFRSLEPHLF